MDVKAEQLFDAIKNGTVTKVKKLIASGADVNAKGDIKGNLKEDAYLLMPCFSGCEYNITTLMYAALHNDTTEIIEMLISSGADVNAKDNYGPKSIK